MPGLIEDYAIVGNCEAAALVGRDGSIDWLAPPRFESVACLAALLRGAPKGRRVVARPRFASAACFAALPGGPENGRCLIPPAAPDAKAPRLYREGTLILETS